MLTRGAAARARVAETAVDTSGETPFEAPECRVQVPHVRQAFNWDCGLACVLMILRALGAKQCDLPALRSLCPTTSIWTIDLAHLLRRFGLDVTFCTVTLGANPDFAQESFYVDSMEEDERRVEQLFKNAAALGIKVERRSVALDELRKCVTDDQCVIIALVDKCKLHHHRSASAELYNRCFGASSGYTGHYVLIYDYSSQTRSFVVQDPASSSAAMVIPEASLENARKTFGTDEDLLVIACNTQLEAGVEEHMLQSRDGQTS